MHGTIKKKKDEMGFTILNYNVNCVCEKIPYEAVTHTYLIQGAELKIPWRTN